jgi:ABC-type uncharacterized transport system ATPase subunit
MVDNQKPQIPRESLISLHGITKHFGDVKANQAIDLEIFQSEVLALLGENGAGKSTLVKILYGFYQADSGIIEYLGKPVAIQSPLDARVLQIGMVFQTFNLIPAFTVAENIALFFPDLDPILNLKRVTERIEQLSKRYNLSVDPNALVMDLSIGDQQKVEILKLLISDARVLILDEPTRVLVPHEIDQLFKVLTSLRADGYAIILITHKMKEVLRIADRITVLRKGKVAGSLLINQATEDALVELMFAKPVSEFQQVARKDKKREQLPLLELRGIRTHAVGAQVSLRNLDLQVHEGEIVGITGVSGNGQRELADVMLGRLSALSGSIHLRDEEVSEFSIHRMRRNGMVFIPENPLLMAVAPFMSVLENVAIPQLWRYTRRAGLSIDWGAVRRDLSRSMEGLGFELPLYVPARSLSGGNLQRMVIARELAHQPRLVIASYLTSGLDVQSAIAARKALVQARDDGAAVLLFSDDLDELFALSDRLIVLQGGRIRGSFKPEETTYQEIGLLMTGSEVLNGN